MTQTPIAQLDFSTVKENLKTFLQGQTQFNDYDFDGSNMSVLLDVLAYNTYYNNFYTNMTYGEMFMDSAQLRESVVSHAKELNYLPASCRSSQAIVQIDLKDVTGSPSFITIPKFTKLTGRSGNKTFTFTTNQSYTITPVDDVYCTPNITVFEGKVITESFKVTGRSRQKFEILNKTLDTSSISVSVRENSEVGAISEEYILKTSILGVNATDPVFYIQPSTEDTYEIAFGQNAFGKSPATNSIIDVTYRVGSKDAANGIDKFTSGRIGTFKTLITTTSPAEGGADRESIESIRFFAPKSIQIQDRAVTETDYEILLKNRFPEIQAVSVYGGEETTPPQYGRVIISVDVKNAEGVSENTKERFRAFLAERCPITVQPVVVSPEFIFVDVATNVFYNTKTTDLSEADVKALVETAITDYSDNSLADFKKTFRYSKLLSAIDAADVNILSNETETRAVIELNPELGTTNSFDLKFRNELIIDHPLISGESVLTHVPAVKSSTFTFDGSRGFIQDDGLGVLNVIRTRGESFVFLKRNIGTVDYATGRVIIRNLKVDAFSGTGVRILAKTAGDDIEAPTDRIISIRKSDINITVTGIRE